MNDDSLLETVYRAWIATEPEKGERGTPDSFVLQYERMRQIEPRLAEMSDDEIGQLLDLLAEGRSLRRPHRTARALEPERQMNFYEAKQTAARYGANQPVFGPTSPAAAAWVECIAGLPLAHDEDRLEEAIAQANRHSG